jgi:hypothetical protein
VFLRFPPETRAHDAVAEVRYLATRPRCYEWVVEGDIKACFDEIDHTALPSTRARPQSASGSRWRWPRSPRTEQSSSQR